MDLQQERLVIQGLREGKAEAWGTMYQHFAPRVWRSVARLMGSNASEIADVVQETFLATAQAAPSFDPSRGSLWQWVWGIARRHVALHFRKEQRQDRLLQAEAWLASRNSDLLSHREATPPDVLEAAELATLVRATLTELPADYELLLTAKYLEGESVEQIANQERSSSTAVRSKLARARQAFRQAFEKYVAPPLV